MSKLRNTLSQTWLTIQTSLFPWLTEELGELTHKQQELVTTLEMIRIEEFILPSYGFPGRPPKDRGAIARAFIAKMVYNMPTTRILLDRLKTDISLRLIFRQFAMARWSLFLKKIKKLEVWVTLNFSRTQSFARSSPVLII